MGDDVLDRWFDSPAVRRAVQASGWRFTGDTVELLDEIIRQVDEPVRERDQTLLDRLAVIAPVLAEGGDARPRNIPGMSIGDQTQIIMMLLDLEADPEMIVGAGFSRTMVDVAVSRHKPWRIEAVRLARSGADSEQIKAAVGPGKSTRWGSVDACLRSHGYHLPSPTTRGARLPRSVQLDILFDALTGNGTQAEIGRRYGVTKDKVSHLVYDYRHRGYFPEINERLSEAA